MAIKKDMGYRLKTKIQVGQEYLTRDGIKVMVDKKYNEDNFGIVDTTGTSFLSNYIVNKFGGFGRCNNYYDLIERL